MDCQKKVFHFSSRKHLPIVVGNHGGFQLSENHLYCE